MRDDLPILTWSVDSPLHIAATALMAEQYALIQSYATDLRQTASVEAVHETRKAIRRLRTAFKLFEPYWPAGALSSHQKSFRQTMRRLAHVRDTDVLVQKLAAFLTAGEHSAEVRAGLESLCAYWREESSAARLALQAHLSAPALEVAHERFEQLLRAESTATWPPVLTIGQAAPVLLYQRLAQLMYQGAGVTTASIPQLHKLRIRGKDLRYTLEFLRPAGDPTRINQALEPLKTLLTHLGDLNDAHVHRRLLQTMNNPISARALYDATLAAEEVRLVGAFYPLWEALATATWQQNLLIAVQLRPDAALFSDR